MEVIIGGYDFGYTKYDSAHKYAYEIARGIAETRAKHDIVKLIDMNEFEFDMFLEIEKACTDEVLDGYISKFCKGEVAIDDFNRESMASSFAYDVVMLKLEKMQKKLDEFLKGLKEGLR